MKCERSVFTLLPLPEAPLCPGVSAAVCYAGAMGRSHPAAGCLYAGAAARSRQMSSL